MNTKSHDALLRIFCLIFLFLQSGTVTYAQQSGGFADAADFGFSPLASGVENRKALQQALDCGGTIVVARQGEYRISGTVYIGRQTTLKFGTDIRLRQVDDGGPFSTVPLNRAAADRASAGLLVLPAPEIVVNDVDARLFKEAYGLHGQLAFFYVRDLRIERFRCYDLGRHQYGIHICTFEDVLINDVIIHGEKDGIHFGRGKRFSVSNGVFKTFDDAIALNAHDYAVGNPEYGWIEEGIIEKCWDLNAENTTGFFCRMLAGGWIDWIEGMEVQQSDIVVADDRLYRVQMNPDGNTYVSRTKPSHTSGIEQLDGINWGVVQEDVIYNCGVRNVVFRDILLAKPRIAFSIRFDHDRFSRSYYKGAPKPVQTQISFDNIRILYDDPVPFIHTNTPVGTVSVTNSFLRNNGFVFNGKDIMDDFGKTKISIVNTCFNLSDHLKLIRNSVPGKEIEIRLLGNTMMDEGYELEWDAGEGTVRVAE